MRRRLSSAFVCTAVLLLAGSAGLATDGQVFGKGLSGTETVTLSALMAAPDEYVGKTIRVEGLVVDVCEKRGCWMELAGDQEFQSIKVKVDDGVIVFPVDLKGKRAVAEGEFTKIVLSAEQQKARMEHEKQEHGNDHAAGEPCEKDVKPGVIYMIKGTGAIVR